MRFNLMCVGFDWLHNKQASVRRSSPVFMTAELCKDLKHKVCFSGSFIKHVTSTQPFFGKHWVPFLHQIVWWKWGFVWNNRWEKVISSGVYVSVKSCVCPERVKVPQWGVWMPATTPYQQPAWCGCVYTCVCQSVWEQCIMGQDCAIVAA